MGLAITRTVRVPLTPADAFRVFTDDLFKWWPVDTHSLAAERGERPENVIVHRQKGGRITEKLRDGSTSDWATITGWQPGKLFAVDWYVGRDPSEATQICVTFEADGTGAIVTLKHDGFERLGAGGTRMAANYRTGWDGVLGQCYFGMCQKPGA